MPLGTASARFETGAGPYQIALYPMALEYENSNESFYPLGRFFTALAFCYHTFPIDKIKIKK